VHRRLWFSADLWVKPKQVIRLMPHLIPDPDDALHTVIVTVHTSACSDAGIDGDVDVFICLFDVEAASLVSTSGEQELGEFQATKQPSSRLFAPGQINEFELKLRELGQVACIEVGHTAGTRWSLEKVTVAAQGAAATACAQLRSRHVLR